MKGIPRTDKETAALWLVAGIRFAIGDNGTRMQDELIDYCRDLKAKADAYDSQRLEDQTNACLDCDHLQAIIQAHAERDRYREALEQIKTNCLRGAHKLGMTADGVQAIADIARAALEHEGGKQ